MGPSKGGANLKRDTQLDKNALLARLPAPWPQDLLARIQAAVREDRRKVVVLDDDPTGTQTVHGIPVLTEWSTASLRAELQSDLPAFYILTNSRSLPPARACERSAAIGHNLVQAARTAGARFVLVSRSDSTLRGHFPGELDALCATLGRSFDGWILCPFFQEGGRVTVDNVHYVQQAEQLVPAAETEFAKDAAFGYRSSHLPQWVEEKTGGRVREKDTRSISIEDIRRGGPQRITQMLLTAAEKRIFVVNAADYRDLEVMVLGLLAAEAAGRTFLYRTAASFVRVRAGIASRPPVTASELNLGGDAGGLIIAGSVVPRTTRQLEKLLQARADIAGHKADIRRLLDESLRADECRRLAASIDRALQNGNTALVYTSRRPLAASDAESSLTAGQQISAALVSILRQVSTRPRYLVAKGGITASDVATGGLQVKRAMVAGQIIPGVPVWQPDAESRYPQLPLIVFPGNVGDDGSLLEVVQQLHPA